MSGRTLRILVADEDLAALERLSLTLRQLGHRVAAYAIEVGEVARKLVGEDPDLAMVVLHADDDHALALIEEIAAYAAGPVVVLTLREDPEFVARAAERGIDAYARPETPDAVQSAIELALRRRSELERLTTKVDQLEGALERRAVIERAKGILMERHGIDQLTAFERLRTHARAGRRRVVDVAREVADGVLELP
ncbi:ANTAR domain-containing protein [Conexibacter arvalis]|uniref:Response regulator NasT n=1 Tax=Conexibacter arvalis TaxID=912552 RepID=A0A840I9M0_9ACTN|nr:response regulator NasT [Conexibacter arvalis]